MVTGPNFGNNNVRFNAFTPIQQKPALNASPSLKPAHSIFQNGPTDSVHFSSKSSLKTPATHNVDFNAISQLDIGNSLDHFKNPTTGQGLLFGSFNA
jgi:hypothetical protein